MKLIVTKDYDELSKACATVVKQLIKENPAMSFCLPAGNSPIGMYQKLITMDIDFSLMTTYNMDEYVGLGSDHPQSYASFAKKMFLDHININFDNVHYINGLALNIEEECQRYNHLIEKTGIDLAISGIGDNGHIAFNEPADYLLTNYHVIELSESTRRQNRGFFNSDHEVPTQAITCGIADFMTAKCVIIIASGPKKNRLLKQFFTDNKVSTQFPVSFLKLHPNCLFIVDEAAMKDIDY